VIRVDRGGPVNLFDKTSHQPETMSLAVQLGFKATAVVADGHGRHFDAGGGLAHRSLLDASPRMIRSMLEYKAPWYGSRIIVVDPAHTSQTCSGCQAVDAASRISRSRFVCTNCGSIFDADVNAAKNILKLGISPTGRLPGMACESSQATGRKQEEDVRESRSSALQGREQSPLPCLPETHARR
jgi:transposase